MGGPNQQFLLRFKPFNEKLFASWFVPCFLNDADLPFGSTGNWNEWNEWLILTGWSFSDHADKTKSREKPWNMISIYTIYIIYTIKMASESIYIIYTKYKLMYKLMYKWLNYAPESQINRDKNRGQRWLHQFLPPGISKLLLPVGRLHQVKQVSQGIGRSHGTVFGTRPAKKCGQEKSLEATSQVCARYVPCSHVQLAFVALTSWILAICKGYEKRVAEPWRLESAHLVPEPNRQLGSCWESSKRNSRYGPLRYHVVWQNHRPVSPPAFWGEDSRWIVGFREPKYIEGTTAPLQLTSYSE